MLPIKRYIENPNLIAKGLLIRYGKFIPDSLYLRMLYWSHTKKKLNIKNPLMFTEKIQWLKLFDRKKEYTDYVDKFEVKKVISALIGEKYIIPTLGVWNSFDDIDFDRLPNAFVLKTTNGGGNTGVVICKNKESFDLNEAKRRLDLSLNHDIYVRNREWPYKNVKKRIMAERYVESADGSDLVDYKIFCFQGEPKFIQVIKDRNTNETIDFYDTKWNHQEFYGLNPKVSQSKDPILSPDGLNEMLSIARTLSKGIPFVRVDLYNNSNKILFGELTLYPNSGFGKFTPEIWDEKMGKYLEVPF